MAYTKGPWSVAPYGNDAWEIVGEGRMIAKVPTFGIPERGDESNAQLIAAAPDLLKAAQTALGYMQDPEGKHGYRALRQLQAAIAKAEGGTR